MKIKGVPIKIMHTYAGFETDNKVGRVVDTCVDPKTGYTACKFELFDTFAGRTIRRMIASDSLDSLSLGHLYHRKDKTVEAQEVSVCFKGARSGTRLYKQLSEYDTFKSKIAESMEAPQDPIAPQEPAAADAAAEPECAENTMDITELLAKCTEGRDDALATAMYTKVADMATQLSSATKSGEAQRASIAELTQLKAKLEKERESASEANTKKAKECVATMNALMAEYVGEPGNIANHGDDSSMYNDVGRALPVLASALASRKLVSNMVSNNEAMRAGLEQRIKAALGPTMPTVWQDKDPSESPQAVQASAHHTTQHDPPAKRSRFYGLTDGQQRALSEIGDYSSTGDRLVTKDMFSDHFKGVAQQWAHHTDNRPPP
jgi:hypothetical protein